MVRVTPIENLGEIRPSSSPGTAPKSPCAVATTTTADPPPKGPIVQIVQNSVRVYLMRIGWYESATAICLRRFLHSKAFAAAAICALFIALFLNDISIIVQSPSSLPQDLVLTIVFGVFGFEFTGFCLVDASYILGFFFWMDLVGMASLPLDISYMWGWPAENPRSNRDTGVGDQVVVARLVRVARIGARAGRLTRVLKLLRYCPIGGTRDEQDVRKVKMARVISNRLTNVLSTRVAFLIICIVVSMPVFDTFKYPEVDGSMNVWATLLNRNMEAFHVAWLAQNATEMDTQRLLIQDEVNRFAEFYSALSYGPFKVCYGELHDDSFVCTPSILDIHFTSVFSEPERKASIREVSQSRFQAQYNLQTPRQEESIAGMGLICFIIFTMSVFGLVLSSGISVIALQPLERMLAAVRERCAQIFKYTTALQTEDVGDGSPEEEAHDEMLQGSEFALLEKVVSKLAAIVQLSTQDEGHNKKEGEMTENDLIKLNWMQGTQATVKNTNAKLEGSQGRESMATARLDDCTVLSTSSAVPTEVLAKLDSPMGDFNTLDLSTELKVAVSLHMMLSSAGSCAWVRQNVQERYLAKFASTIESKYPANPFHNFSHGVDVLYQVYLFMTLIEAHKFLPEQTQFWLMVAALGHDVGHLGVNNLFLIESSHELAMKYNDRSPMEMMHCAKLFQVASEPDSNIFGLLDKDLYRQIRKSMIDAILHTDMVKHNEMVKEMSLLYQMNSDQFDNLEPAQVLTQGGNLQLVTNALLHGADIANPMKPWKLCHVLANACLDEFFAQGDLEKEAGLPVQVLNDRDKVNRPNSQIGFIEFVICPIAEVLVSTFPQLDMLAENLGENLIRWAEVWRTETCPPEDAIAKVEMRVQKTVDRCEALMRQDSRLPVGGH